MRQYVLTRSSYGPEWSIDANRRRLAITEGVTARMMARQTVKDWSWVVLLDRRDPLLADRLAVFRSAGHVIPVYWEPDQKDAKLAEWDKNSRLFTGKLDEDQERRSAKSRIAATAYKVDWAKYMTAARKLMTRLDDDDALAADSLERTLRASTRLDRRTVLMQPMGYRVWNSRYSLVKHETNAMHTLLTISGDPMTVYDYGHRKCASVAPVVTVDTMPGWLWVRHPDTISGWKKADNPVSERLKRMFPVDWRII